MNRKFSLIINLLSVETHFEDSCGNPTVNKYGKIMSGRNAMRKQWPWIG
jgi:hypothetical protein